MFKMSSLYIASVKESFRFFTLVIVFSAFFAPLAPLTQTSVTAQSDYGFQTFETEKANATTPIFEREYLPQNQNLTLSAISTKQDSLTPSGENLRGRGNPPPPPTTTNPQWTIAATPGVKISVNHDGWYRISANQLEMAGFPVSSNRTYWQLFTGAQEQPIKTGADGSIEFYGKELDTVETDTRVYYLIYGQTAGKRIGIGTVKSSDANNAPNFDITVERKPRINYIPTILNGDAENWFGQLIEPAQPLTENLTVYDQDSSGTARLSVKLQGLTSGQHTVSVKFNNLTVGNASFSNYQNTTFNFDVPMAAVVAGANQVSLQATASSGDYSMFDSVSLTYKRLYEARDNRLHFSVPARKGLRVVDFTENSINVFELQNGQVIGELTVRVDPDGSNYAFSLAATKNNRELMAVTNSRKESPLKVEANVPSMLNSSSNTADMLIIAPAVFGQYAQTLANMRIQQGLNAKVVTTDDIFDEFGYGVRSAQGIKDFLRHATTSWQVKPRYVLLVRRFELRFEKLSRH